MGYACLGAKKMELSHVCACVRGERRAKNLYIATWIRNKPIPNRDGPTEGFSLFLLLFCFYSASSENLGLAKQVFAFMRSYILKQKRPRFATFLPLFFRLQNATTHLHGDFFKRSQYCYIQNGWR